MVQVANLTNRKLNTAQRDRVLWWQTVEIYYQGVVTLLDAFSSSEDDKTIRYHIRLLNNYDQAIRQIPCPASAQDFFINLTQAVSSLLQAYESLLQGDWETADQQSDITVVCLIALQSELTIYDISIS